MKTGLYAKKGFLVLVGENHIIGENGIKYRKDEINWCEYRKVKMESNKPWYRRGATQKIKSLKDGIYYFVGPFHNMFFAKSGLYHVCIAKEKGFLRFDGFYEVSNIGYEVYGDIFRLKAKEKWK